MPECRITFARRGQAAPDSSRSISWRGVGGCLSSTSSTCGQPSVPRMRYDLSKSLRSRSSPITFIASDGCRWAIRITPIGGRKSRAASRVGFPLTSAGVRNGFRDGSGASGSVAIGNISFATSRIFGATWITSTSIQSNTDTCRGRSTGPIRRSLDGSPMGTTLRIGRSTPGPKPA